MVDWKYAYRQRLLLERNWINGDFSSHEISNAHNEAIYCLQFDEDKIISGSRDNTVQVFDTATLAHRHTLVGHSGSVLCLQFDDSILVTGSSDSTIMVWNLPSTKPSSAATATTQPPSTTLSPTRILKSHKQSVLNIKFDSRWIVSCSKDKTIKVWSQTDGSLLRTLKGHKAAVNAVQFKGNVCVSASGDRTIKVWNLETGETLKTLVGHLRGIACIQFDGNVIVSGSSDKTIRIWNVHTGQLIRTLEGHTELVRTLQFDQTRIVSGSYDRSIKIWNIVFTDIFEVGDVNRGGKKFDRVSRLNATSEAADTEIILDINTEIYPIKISDKFTLTLATSLSLDAVAAAPSTTASKKETWRDTSSSGKSLADDYEYVMYGKVYKYDESGGKNLATVYISFGGLLLVVSGEPIDLLVGQEVYLLMRKNS
ncbi:DNA-directed RNA polymerases I, II, and III subunit RPABC3 [Chytriomyces hyalinus]|nr:DNA-directed RNA polymerases I, II, and III subunit RPABC3 [Chytriomyces hyalinus]